MGLPRSGIPSSSSSLVPSMQTHPILEPNLEKRTGPPMQVRKRGWAARLVQQQRFRVDGAYREENERCILYPARIGHRMLVSKR